jgi:hypothetical protein
MPKTDADLGPRSAVCARCGGDVEWSFSDAAKTRVTVVCPDCGRYELPREDFDAAETEIVEPGDRE